MKKPLTPQEALHKAAALCSLNEACLSDIAAKLTLWGISYNDRQTILNRLLTEKFIDESRYCQSFVNDKLRFNKWGKIKIRYQLKQKNINNELIENALSSIDDETYESILNDIISAKAKSTSAKNEYELKAKIFRFASGRGFEPHIISRVLHFSENDETL